MTTTTDPRATRYLLGELTEADMTAFEREYMSDPDVFARLVQSETALVDDYVRHRLTPEIHRRFEEHYLSHPKRRERVAFARVLAAKIDERQSTEATAKATPPSWWKAIANFGTWPTWTVALAAASIVLLLSTVWFVIQSNRLRGELARSERARSLDAERARDLQNQLSTAQTESGALKTELERLKTAPAPTPAASATAPVISLLLTVPSTRTPATGEAKIVAIPQDAREFRVELALDETEYATYQISLNPVGAPVIFTRPHLMPRKVRDGARLAVSVPAERLAAGDYMLTLRGERPGGGLETVSQLLFHVTR
jgi:hypothetical protein